VDHVHGAAELVFLGQLLRADEVKDSPVNGASAAVFRPMSDS